ncbi:MAG TPA: hypothetical protein VF693_06090 [Allosphingosinicella sp.]|jgi:hypothetical protein
MIPIVREFFRGLRERGELDVIIPELLTAMGYEVISRPMIGTRQYGADVAAIGTDDDGVRKLFLFVIKKGDLTRDEWDISPQAVRPSLNEVRDAYLSGVAPTHKGMPVVVVITIGGIVAENIQRLVNGYMEAESKAGIEFRLWSGDTLTGKVVDGALREEVFPPALRTLLRRAAALVDEPEAAFAQFAQLVTEVAGDDKQDAVSRTRILYLALWILTVWAREADNLEAAYSASELVVLRAWALLAPTIARDRSPKKVAGHSFFEIVQLHLTIWEDLYGAKVLPHAASRHALSYAAWSQESLDINLALFKTIGRIAMGGLWYAWLTILDGDRPIPLDKPDKRLEAVAIALAGMIDANPTLYTPACEDQGIDIALALMLLAIIPATRNHAAHWVSQMTRAIITCYYRGSRYPVIETDYATLIRLPQERDDKLRKELTSASIIQPLLAAFAHGFGEREAIEELDEFQRDDLAHANYQIWVPNARSEAAIWLGRRNGSAMGGLKIGSDGEPVMSALRRETEQNTAYTDLSAIKLHHWPVLLLACRFYRLPPPPQLWLPLVEALGVTGSTDRVAWRSAGPRSLGGRKRVYGRLLRSVSFVAILNSTNL